MTLPSSVPSFVRVGDFISVPNAGAELLSELLDIHERQLAGLGLELRAVMHDGLPRQSITDVFAEAGLVPPDELMAYFSWHNGMSETGWRGPLLPWLRPVSIDRVVTSWNEHRAFGWSVSPYVVLDDDLRGHAVVLDENAGSPPQTMWVDEDNPIVGIRILPRMRSMCTWVTSWIMAIESGFSMLEGASDQRHWSVNPDRWPHFQETGAAELR